MSIPTLAVDFDGTIVEHKFPLIGVLKPGVKEAMQELHKKYYIIIFSVRATWGIFNGYPKCVEEMIEFLKQNDIPYDLIARKDCGKPLADYYIDDRAIEFKDNWREITLRLKGA